MKKGLIGLVMVLTLGVVGCNSTEPTDTEMEAYFNSEREYFKVVTDSTKWQDEIYSNMDSLNYEELKEIVNEKKDMVDNIELKNIEKYFKFKEYSNPDETIVKELRKDDFKEVKVKTDKLKENIKLYDEMVELLSDGDISDQELEVKASLVTKIDLNSDIITSVGLQSE
ncbi:MAG: hypothetical protein ACRDA3_00030 [Peptostreptococcaceae bacterium]